MAPPGVSPSQTPPCRFPAAGSSSKTLRVGPDMSDPRRQQRMTPQELGISLPRHSVAARATIQPLPPDPNNTPIELQKALRVCRAAVVLVVASELGVEGLLLLVHRCMSVLLALCGDRREAPAKPLAHRSHMHGELPSPAAAHMCVRPRKSKVPGFFFPCFFARSSA